MTLPEAAPPDCAIEVLSIEKREALVPESVRVMLLVRSEPVNVTEPVADVPSSVVMPTDDFDAKIVGPSVVITGFHAVGVPDL